MTNAGWLFGGTANVALVGTTLEPARVASRVVFGITWGELRFGIRMSYAGGGVGIALENPKPRTFNNSRALELDDVLSVLIEIFIKDYSVAVLPPTPMVWSPDEKTWVYSWDTSSPPIESGTYWAMITITDVAGVPWIGYQRIRLKRRPT